MDGHGWCSWDVGCSRHRGAGICRRGGEVDGEGRSAGATPAESTAAGGQISKKMQPNSNE